MGGGMQGLPVRGPAGPRSPLLPAATPPRQGRGLRPVRRWSKGGGGGGDYVWSIAWCPSLCPVCGRPRGMVGGGVQAWAGRVGSGGRPRRRRRHAGAGPVAVAGRCGRTGRRPAVALRAPLHGVAGRAGGTRAAQAWPWGGRVQGRRRARCGPHCGPRDQWQPGSVAWGPRPGPGAWVAAGGRGGGGAMRVRGPWRPRRTQADRPAAGGGPKSPTPWGRRARWGCRGVVRCRGAAVRGGAGAQQCGAAQGRGAGLRRGAALGCVGAVAARRARWGGGGLWAGGWVRARGGRGCAELSRRASPCGRRGGGAAGAGQSWPGSPGRSRCRGGRGQRWGPHPARRGRIPPSIIHGGESWWRRGGVPRCPLAAEPDRDGPRRRDTGGAGGAGHRGSGARVPGGCGPARGRPGGPLGCGW